MTRPLLSLDPTGLDSLFPFHVRLNATGMIAGVGPTLSLMLQTDVTGAAFLDIFAIRKPRHVKTYGDIVQLGRKPMTMMLADGDAEPVELRGIACPCGNDGEVLIDFALGANMLDAITRFDLKASHFKPNDTSVNLLYSVQTQRTLLEDSQKLASQLATAKEQAERIASTDTVTGIGNRHALKTVLEALIASTDSHIEHAVLQIDLNKFKAINDAFGHAVGDDVLRQTAKIMEGFAGDVISTSRLGGDEFAMLLRDPPATDVLIRQAQDLAARIEQPMTIDDHSCQVGASIGIARFTPAQIVSPEQPLIDADVALYEAKSERQAAVFATPSLLDRHLCRMTMKRQIEAAIADDAFIPYFQPQIDIRKGKVIGAEVLARWNHPTRGILSPYHWLAEANHADLMYMIDRTIIRKAIAAFQRLRKDGCFVGKLSLNLTLANLRSDTFLEELQDLLFAAGTPHNEVQLELLEAILFDPDDRVLVKRCDAFKAAGFHLALDDFGTGHASIATLINTPISLLKIDRSLIAGIDQNVRLQQIMRAVLAMCQQMELDVIAEGVETAAELKLVTEYGCGLVQGYYFSQPLNEFDFESWLVEFQAAQMVSRIVR